MRLVHVTAQALEEPRNLPNTNARKVGRTWVWADNGHWTRTEEESRTCESSVVDRMRFLSLPLRADCTCRDFCNNWGHWETKQQLATHSERGGATGHLTQSFPNCASRIPRPLRRFSAGSIDTVTTYAPSHLDVWGSRRITPLILNVDTKLKKKITLWL
jgi:hypothetical protein